MFTVVTQISPQTQRHAHHMSEKLLSRAQQPNTSQPQCFLKRRVCSSIVWGLQQLATGKYETHYSVPQTLARLSFRKATIAGCALHRMLWSYNPRLELWDLHKEPVE